ncbi:hypothetical protein J6590_076913 [Homalodisca vitripennis]|nr:hypothetical protein J6590_076913 [Homalodisca vitripennis]
MVPKGSLTIILNPRPRTLTSTRPLYLNTAQRLPHNLRSLLANLAVIILPEPVQKNSGCWLSCLRLMMDYARQIQIYSGTRRICRCCDSQSRMSVDEPFTRNGHGRFQLLSLGCLHVGWQKVEELLSYVRWFLKHCVV